jgi:murein L,D-transpeptidase YafK
MNPRSSFHLSFNLGYPNALDRSQDRTGNFLMVHGDCRSAGCYAMTDALIEEIYAIAREAFNGGQKRFQVQALPFRMHDVNMRRYSKQNKRWRGFWKDLKKGYDAFEYTHIPPKIDVCGRRYIVNAVFIDEQRDLPAREACPPYQTFVPDIMETADGPQIVQTEVGTRNPYRAARANRPRPAAVMSGNPSQLLGNRMSPVNRNSLAVRNSIEISQ